jgi:hypothetical protein
MDAAFTTSEKKSLAAAAALDHPSLMAELVLAVDASSSHVGGLLYDSAGAVRLPGNRWSFPQGSLMPPNQNTTLSVENYGRCTSTICWRVGGSWFPTTRKPLTSTFSGSLNCGQRDSNDTWYTLQCLAHHFLPPLHARV